MLGIIIAMEKEVLDFSGLVENLECHKKGGINFYLSKDKRIVLAISGIGKTNAASATGAMISSFGVTQILNFGLVGCNSKRIKNGDFVLVDNFYYLDVDATAFGYDYGQVPNEKKFFTSSGELNKKISKLIFTENEQLLITSLATSDSFISKDNFHKWPQNILMVTEIFDMEAAAIAQICSKNNIPVSSFKIISDNMSNNLKLSADQFQESITSCSTKIRSKVEALLK